MVTLLDLGSYSYKYLVIPQANGNHKATTRKSATGKYLHRVRQGNNIQAINTYALPVIRYPAGINSWPKGGDRGYCYQGKEAICTQTQIHTFSKWQMVALATPAGLLAQFKGSGRDLCC